MSKVTLALGSFIVGVCCSLVGFSLIHTSTRVHAQVGLKIEGAEPVVPPLRFHTKGGVFRGATQALDGIDCETCLIEAPILTYGGGAFNCTACTLHASRVVLTGAADNTFKALLLFGVIPSPKPAPNIPKTPLLKANEIQISPQEKIDLVSLAGLKQ